MEPPFRFLQHPEDVYDIVGNIKEFEGIQVCNAPMPYEANIDVSLNFAVADDGGFVLLLTSVTQVVPPDVIYEILSRIYGLYGNRDFVASVNSFALDVAVRRAAEGTVDAAISQLARRTNINTIHIKFFHYELLKPLLRILFITVIQRIVADMGPQFFVYLHIHRPDMSQPQLKAKYEYDDDATVRQDIDKRLARLHFLERDTGLPSEITKRIGKFVGKSIKEDHPILSHRPIPARLRKGWKHAK